MHMTYIELSNFLSSVSSIAFFISMVVAIFAFAFLYFTSNKYMESKNNKPVQKEANTDSEKFE